MNLGFVFTSYNNTPFTQELLNSLAHVQGVENCRVVVVDNNSDEKNRDELISACSNIPYVSLILNDENVGYFKGLNIGIRQLRATLADCNCVVIGNNDLIFSPDFVESIFRNEAIFNHPVIAPDIVTANGVHQNPHVIKKIGWFRELFYDLYHLNYHLSKVITFASNCFPVAKRRDHDFYHLAGEIHQGYGACYILGPIFFEHFDSLWAPTFLLGEEYFLSLQIERKGFRIFYDPSISVFHSEHATTRKVPRRQMWEIARASHKVYRKYKARF